MTPPTMWNWMNMILIAMIIIWVAIHNHKGDVNK